MHTLQYLIFIFYEVCGIDACEDDGESAWTLSLLALHFASFHLSFTTRHVWQLS